MAAPGEPKLTDEARAYVVQSLAMFDAPSVIAAAVKKDFGLVITPQGIEAYNPLRKAGEKLSEKWKALFTATREAFLSNTADIGVSHRAMRLRGLQRMFEKAENQGNLALAAQLLEQAAKEAGGAFTNKREISGPNGGAIPINAVTAAMSPKEAAEAYAATLNGEG